MRIVLTSGLFLSIFFCSVGGKHFLIETEDRNGAQWNYDYNVTKRWGVAFCLLIVGFLWSLHCFFFLISIFIVYSRPKGGKDYSIHSSEGGLDYANNGFGEAPCPCLCPPSPSPPSPSHFGDAGYLDFRSTISKSVINFLPMIIRRSYHSSRQ